MRVDCSVVGPSGSTGAGTGVVMLEEEEVVVVRTITRQQKSRAMNARCLQSSLAIIVMMTWVVLC